MGRSIDKWLERKLGPARVNGVEYNVCCPFCDNGTDFKLYYNAQKDVFNCFKCGASGKGIDLIMQVQSCSVLMAKSYLQPSNIKLPPSKVLTSLPDWYQPLLPNPTASKPGYEAVYNYATQSRHFTTAQIEFYGLGYAVGNYKLMSRLIIPIERGYYQARAIYKNKIPKYINPDVPKDGRLFNYRFLGQPHIAICEGCISAIAAMSIPGDPPALATLGKTATYEQMKRIADAGTKCVELAYDAGTEYSDSTLDFAGYLYSRDIEVIIRSYTFGDPDECNDYVRYAYTPKYKLKARLSRLR